MCLIQWVTISTVVRVFVQLLEYGGKELHANVK